MRILSINIFFGLILSVGFGLKFSQAESIATYNINTKIFEDSSFEVEEEIHYNFGSARRQGIYRDIPVYIRRPTDTGLFGTVSANYTVKITVLSVTDEDSIPYNYKLMDSGGNLRIRIGTPGDYLTGNQIYKIRYKVKRAINEFETNDEFYWNFVGTGWHIPINNISLKVFFPTEVLPDEFKYQSFYGAYGSTQTISGELSSGAYFIEVESLKPREALTSNFSFPKGYLTPPGKITKLIWFLKDNISNFFLLLGPLLMFGFFFIAHRKYGRDPDQGLPITVQYGPPEDLHPAEVGTLVDETADLSDIVSTIVDLAVRGFIKIEVIESSYALFFSNKDYKLHLLKRSTRDLTDYEKLFLKKVFYDRTVIQLSSLKEKFYSHISSLKTSLYKDLVKKNIFNDSPESVRNSYIFYGLTLGVIFYVLTFVIGKYLDNAANFGLLALSSVITFIIIITWQKFMPRKTKKGAQRYREALGLKEFIERVEKDRIEVLHSEDPEIFGRILPYAMVLGYADKWADKFDGLLTEPPTWYSSPYFHRSGFRFESRTFVNEVGQGLNTMEKTFKSQPANSGSGGSSGFGGMGSSGGGGFSGGGFGGGGGGSW